ncbi:hypothetical protein EC957_006384 [Mortierella hygrophila]|uniref:Protein Zds1 C-terminal domain-containing protein n=1 Tax=Mortierella hygrophila TaxID=979708 RepID=A0A9P6EY55_9FUNG|nr:hypothetical protein EC957_006384 [Mortierella hygrophila]
MLKDDRHIQSTVALLENANSSNGQVPFQAIDLDRSQGSGNDVDALPEASAAATLGSHTSTRSKREIIALDGFMFDSSVLQDRDDQPSTVEEHRQDRGFGNPSPRDHYDEDTPEDILLNDIKQQQAPSPSPTSSASSALSLSPSSSSPSSSPSSPTSSITTAPYNPSDQSPGSDSGSAESFFSLSEERANSEQSQSPLPTLASSHEELGHNEDPGDIKEVQIEAEDPSHLFWVPFHMHPEIAPNAYNNWLHKHGVDSTGQSTFLAVRKSSVNRRRSVLSAEYNPELDEEDEERAPAPRSLDPVKESKEGMHGYSAETNTDFLSGVFSAPLEQMGEPPLKAKTSLRRSLSHTRNVPSHATSDEGSVEEDLATVRRTGGLQRSGPSLLRRSARTKIRRNSTASYDKNDVSRLRQSTDENGEYPAVTLVDPGPLPLPSDNPTVILTSADHSSDDHGAAAQPNESKPLRRFVSTLRDPSKPTITTYVEPELLEQQRQEIEGVSKPSVTSSSVAHSSLAEHPDLSAYTGAVISTVTYPIPPPVKLTQNLLQHPSLQSRPAAERTPVPSQPARQPQPKQPLPSATPPPSSSASKKSSTWSWLRGKERDGEVQLDTKLQPKRDAAAAALPSVPTSKATAKKPSTLSLLFSRTGKTSTKPQPTVSGPLTPATSRGPQRNTLLNDGYEIDPCRMPINTERAIYRLSHVKLANPRRPLHEQVLISNMMFWYLGVIEQETEMQHQHQQQQAHPQAIPLPPNHNSSELSQQQQHQQSSSIHQGSLDAAQGSLEDYTNGKTIEAGSSLPASSLSPSLRQKRSQPELSTIEVRVEGSEYFVPQQDSNSHARSPGKEVIIEFMHVDANDADYDEESMIGGFSEQYEWSDEDDSQTAAESDAGDKGNSVYLRSGSPVQSGFSVYSTSSIDLSNGPGTVSVV